MNSVTQTTEAEGMKLTGSSTVSTLPQSMRVHHKEGRLMTKWFWTNQAYLFLASVPGEENVLQESSSYTTTNNPVNQEVPGARFSTSSETYLGPSGVTFMGYQPQPQRLTQPAQMLSRHKP
ncbi:uncharacterized protein LOC128930339 isoform X2 [Callithrix jacchus]